MGTPSLLLASLVLLHCASLLYGQGTLNITYDVPYGMCLAPESALSFERTGSLTDNLLVLCLRSSQTITSFDNAEKFFIGNRTNPAVTAPGVLCANITSAFTISVQDPVSENSTYTFGQGELPNDESTLTQAWELTTWDPVDPAQDDQVVNLTISNFGPSNLIFTGLGGATDSVDDDTVFPTGNVTTLLLNRTAVNLTYDGFPILEAYLTSNNNGIPKDTVTALVFVKIFDQSTSIADADAVHLVTYAIVLDTKSTVVSQRFKFFLYEKTLYTDPPAGSRRRLLVVGATNKAPPAACSKGCCKPAAPLPKTCTKKSKTWPSCATKCGCACK